MNLSDLDATSTGAELLDDVRGALVRYVVLPSSEAADAVTLWIACTHTQSAWNTATRLVITAPTKRCGKSRLLDIVEATCHRPLIAVNISPAALVRSVGADPPTILLDEADTFFGRKAADNHEDLRGIVNAGHQRNRPYVRWDATARRLENCPTFAMVALAGIGDLPDTVMDRAVIVRMRRRAPGETVRPFRTRRDAPPLNELSDRLTAWLSDRAEELADVEPSMPVEDRAADNWEPLIVVADAAGGEWPERARTACKVLTAAAEEDTTVGIRLLSDLREIFGDAEALHGATILDALHKLDEAPWADWYGRPFGAVDLAKHLRPYGVRSTKVKVDGKALQGYRRDHLYDAWARYLPAGREGAGTSGTPGTVQVSDSGQVPGSGQQVEPGTLPNAVTSEVPGVPQVPDTPRRSACDAPIDIAEWNARARDRSQRNRS